jgi:hypothetical protein
MQRREAAQLAQLAKSRKPPPKPTLRPPSQTQLLSFLFSFRANLRNSIVAKHDGGSATMDAPRHERTVS